MKDFYFTLKTYIYLIPPIQILTLVVLASIELSTNYKFSETQLSNLGLNLGNSNATLLVYVVIFFNPKLRYCLFTRCMVVGIVLNQFLYYLSIFISNELFNKLYTIICFGVAIVGYWILLFKNKQ